MEREIRRAALVRHPHRDCHALSETVEKALQCHGVQAVLLDAGSAHPEGLDAIDLAVSLGGDGTLLSTARLFYGRAIPVFAVNSGTFGFLTAISHTEITTALDAFFAGNTAFEERIMLSARVLRRGGQPETVEGNFLALNEIVVTRQGIIGMIALDVWVNGEFLCAYRADGLIVATPTGSTGYSLSADGPILMPTLANMIITPICAHSVSSRPFVVAGDDVITITVGEGRIRSTLTADAQGGMELADGDVIEIRRAEHPLLLACSSERTSLGVLRTKLAWNGSPGAQTAHSPMGIEGDAE
jgi:NAD+ kinase